MESILALMIPLAPFIMVLGIVWITKRSKLEEKRLDAAASTSAEKAAQYAGDIRALEERIQVLERIVTDRGYDVATQIEALRDTRRVDEALHGSADPMRDAGTPLDLPKRERA
jgi:phage shock protein B